jgi:hypothetical protein
LIWSISRDILRALDLVVNSWELVDVDVDFDVGVDVAFVVETRSLRSRCEAEVESKLRVDLAF